MVVFDDVVRARRLVNDRLRIDEAQVQLRPLVARRSRVGFDPHCPFSKFIASPLRVHMGKYYETLTIA